MTGERRDGRDLAQSLLLSTLLFPWLPALPDSWLKSLMDPIVPQIEVHGAGRLSHLPKNRPESTCDQPHELPS